MEEKKAENKTEAEQEAKAQEAEAQEEQEVQEEQEEQEEAQEQQQERQEASRPCSPQTPRAAAACASAAGHRCSLKISPSSNLRLNPRKELLLPLCPAICARPARAASPPLFAVPRGSEMQSIAGVTTHVFAVLVHG